MTKSAFSSFLISFAVFPLIVMWVFPHLVSSVSRRQYNQLELPSGTYGPETLVFDCNGEGPYTGVSDGRILKWHGSEVGWKDFAVTSPLRTSRLCDGSSDTSAEHVCGRPLGLKFNQATCDLYIADAYFGLLVVGRKGGLARQLATSAEGVPFLFANALDIDQKTGAVYFTDTSTRFRRWEFGIAMESGDNTGRLMRYDPKTKKVKVLLKHLFFSNGVALSRNSSFLLVTETNANRVLRFWLEGPRSQTRDVFAKLDGCPDNIERNPKGEFWVAQNPKFDSIGTPLQTNISALKLDEEGKVLRVLNEEFGSLSDVIEKDDCMWLGSVLQSHVGMIL
ncbi:hypothetical protein PVL29_013750 [Vitis rotundifolia]|nr:hypothetical protein PVL29_013750 [Vitis rotundifolia]